MHSLRQSSPYLQTNTPRLITAQQNTAVRNGEESRFFPAYSAEAQVPSSGGFFGRQEINYQMSSALRQIDSILEKSDHHVLDQKQHFVLYSQILSLYKLLSTHPNKSTIPGAVIAKTYSRAIMCINNAAHCSSDVFKISCDLTELITDQFSPKIVENYHRKHVEQNLYEFSIKLNSERMQSILRKNPISANGTPTREIFLKIISFHVKMGAQNITNLKYNMHDSFIEYQPFLKQFYPVFNPAYGVDQPWPMLADNIITLVQDILDGAILFANGLMTITADLINLGSGIVSDFISMLLQGFSPFGLRFENRNHRTGLPLIPRFHSAPHFFAHMLPHIHGRMNGNEYLLMSQMEPHLAQANPRDVDFEHLVSLQLSVFENAPKAARKEIGTKLFQEIDQFQNFYILLKGSCEFGFVYSTDKIEAMVKKIFHYIARGVTDTQFVTAQRFIALLDNMNSMGNFLDANIVNMLYVFSTEVLASQDGLLTAQKANSQKIQFSIYVLKVLLSSNNPIIRDTLTVQQREFVREIAMKQNILELNRTFM